MNPAVAALRQLARQRPAWGGWLAVVGEALRETGASVWEDAVPGRACAPRQGVPLLVGADVVVDASAVRRLLRRLIRLASRAGTPRMATLGSVLDVEPDALALFTASLRLESASAAKIAGLCGADADALQAVVALLPLPFLQACHRRWASVLSPGWMEGYCPVCGAWPAFAETRGIERSRFYRCGRCGAEWHARPLRCFRCGEDDHRALASMVVDDGSNATIDACESCRACLKTFSRLRGCPPEMVLVEDLASVHLDIAALERGYTRPAGAGHPIGGAVA